MAFRSIDGPPPQVFDRFVRVLDNQAQAETSPSCLVTEAPAIPVRRYLSAQVHGGRTTIAWVRDVC